MKLHVPTASGARHAAARWLRQFGREHSGERPYKYQALVTLNPPGEGGLDTESPLHVRHLTVRARNPATGHTAIFRALVSVADGSLLSPGSTDVIATLLVLGTGVPDYLAPGARFELLSGSEVGHGVVSRRMFT